MSPWPEPLARAYAACEALARSHYENFPVASRLLPRAMRPHIAAVYAFARLADDMADEGSAPASERLAQLDAWQMRLHSALSDDLSDAALSDAALSRAALSRAVPGAVSGAVSGDRSPEAAALEDLIIVALAHSIRLLDLPLNLFDDLISAFGQDTMTKRYASWADVLDYCRRSANPIGRLVLRIGGYRDGSLDRSSDALCTALQLTNFWQDMGRDWRAGRLYVPREVQIACGANEADLAAPLNPAWTRAVEACVAMTRTIFADGRAVCDGVRGRLRFELRTTWLGGALILERVQDAGASLPGNRPTLGAWDVPGLVWAAATWRAGTRTAGAPIAGSGGARP